jgi:hypothetical protein
MVNNGGVTPVHTPAIWQLSVPPRIHVFLWLLANNKALKRDNLHKRRHVEDRTCLFYSDLESVDHLFFKCFVVSHIWYFLSEVFNVQVGADFESVARWWISNNKNVVLNLFSSATLWSIWSLRNELCFQRPSWLGKVYACIRRWQVLDVHSSLLDRNLLLLEKRCAEL